MQQLSSAPRLKASLQRSWAWVLDQPLAEELNGQSCDRLRPAQVRRDLEAALSQSAMGGCTLVEWRWDQRQGRVEGWLWERSLLQRFHWWRHSGRLTLRQQLQCTTRAPLQALA
jgi:hypothetical protein